MNTTSWTYDSGYPSIFQGEGLNQSCVCLNSDWQALIRFFKSAWKRNSLLPERYEVPGLIVTWTDVWQVGACDWEACQSPSLLIHFIILEPKSGVCEAVPDFSFCSPERVLGTRFFGEGWRNMIRACLLRERFCSLTAAEMCVIPVGCIKNILKGRLSGSVG